MATEYAQRLSTPVIILHKRRESGTETTITRVVGDVGDRPCLIVDDMISTGGTIADSMEALLRAGARADITVAALMAYSWRALTQNSRVLRSGRFSSQIRSIAPGGPG